MAQEGWAKWEVEDEQANLGLMAMADEESRLNEEAIKEAEAEAERLRLLQLEYEAAAAEARRVYQVDLEALEKERSELEARAEAAKAEEDWDLFEELDEALQSLPTTVEGYRERNAERARAAMEEEIANEEAERQDMALEDKPEDKLPPEPTEGAGAEGAEGAGDDQFVNAK
eukprot:CAMPEP_0172602306 /NCGR_PEP_ID=MMETSP1068-20121228/22479_1 /TAXON_ID=35684 /ORGANISM="Pseudopedinella elastica, Strain CCMP716" /LENGTH=171 /DNA_ID=CAMNT_0013403601 /DNA_START=75 /DNA_END=590 /DNA_ORIENTATION=+